MALYGGVLGDALLDASNAYLRAVVDAPKERAEQEKRELENQRLRSQSKLDEARAAFEERRVSGYTGRPVYVKTKRGDILERNADTGDWGVAFEAPVTDVQAKLKDQREQMIHRAMEKIIGGADGPRPMATWGPAEVSDRRLMPYWELLGQGRSQYATVPGNLGDVLPKRDLPGQGGTEAPQGQPRQEPATTTGSAQPPVTRPAGQPPAQAPKPPAGVPPGAVQADPQWLQHYNTRLKDLPIEKANEQWAVITSAPGVKPGAVAAFAEAYNRRYGSMPPGEEGKAGAPASPPGSTTFPDKTPTPAPKPTPPPGRATGGRERNVPLTNEQLEKQNLEHWNATRQWEASEQQRLEAERVEAERQYQHQLDKLGGRPTKDQERVTNKLFVAGDPDVTADNYLQLSPKGRQKVNHQIRLPVIRKEEQSWKKLAEPHMEELQALKMTQQLTDRILPLIEVGNLGMRGRGSQWFLWAKSQMPSYRSQFYQEAEKVLKDQGKEITDATVQAQVAAMVETNDPDTRKRMREIAGRGRLQALSSILMYAHALAQKRLTGGTQRGIIKSDMEEAEKLFNPDLFFTDPDTLFARLQELQGFIQSARSHIEDKVRSFHFDPATRKYIPAESEQMPDDDASELQKIRDIVKGK